MTVDNLYLENIDEFLNDENRIVTYKWLSLTLQVHCNTAKQMLYKFVKDHRKGKPESTVTVAYFVSGLSKKSSENEQAFKCAVIPEGRLEAYKAGLEVVTSCHIYSIQKVKLKDSNALYMTDYDKVSEDVLNSNKYSAISSAHIKVRSEDDLSVLRPQFRAVPDQTDKKPTVSNGQGPTSSLSAGKKPVKASGIAGMFAKQEKKTSPVKQEEKTESKKTENKPGDKSSKKPAAGGMMASFLSKQTVKKVEPVKKEEKKKSPEAKKTEIGTSKKTSRVEDSDEDVKASKRRRIKDDLFASSEEEDEEEEPMEVEPESPIRASPKEPTPEPEPKPKIKGKKETKPSKEKCETKKSTKKEPLEEEDPISNETSKVTESGKGDNINSNSGGKRRKHVRKMVPKTYVGEDGFMVTEKAYESCSTDASDTEEPVVSKASAPKQQAPGNKDKKKPSPGKSPGKKGGAVNAQVGGKQTSLMSFFKKK